MAKQAEPKGLDAAYGTAPDVDRKETGDPAAPPAAATETLGELMVDEADARAAQADRADFDDDEEDEKTVARRRRAYDLWEQEGRPEGRHEAHWLAAGDADQPEPGTDPWTEGP